MPAADNESPVTGRTSADPEPRIASASAADRYHNRELSWLAFNTRVLEEAANREHPLLERLRFLSISGSNLDEFVMVRVAGLVGQERRGIEELSIDGRTPTQQLSAIHAELSVLLERQSHEWSRLHGELTEAGVEVLGDERQDPETARWLKRYFRETLQPVITPQAIDPAHPFPFVHNRGMGILFALQRDDDSEQVLQMVLVPQSLPRFIRLPDIPGSGTEGTDGAPDAQPVTARYISIERLLRRHGDVLFAGFSVQSSCVFRVLRDSDIEIEEEAEDLVRFYRTAIQRRRRGTIILLEVSGDLSPSAESVLREHLGLDDMRVHAADGLIGFEALAELVETDRPDLKFEPYTPRYPERIAQHDGDCFAAIREKEFIVHHPYESFEVVVDFLKQAARDPDVVAIKQTLYRAGTQSSVVSALIAAAEAGKAVTAVVELKARFDEEQNLLWASQLESAGVQVIYGFVDWKTHAKVSMVVRRERSGDGDGDGDAGASGYRTYCHFGTGNYHPVNARIYTDLSFFTDDPKAARDAGKLFNFITGYVKPERTELLSISPANLREQLTACIDREIENAKGGRPSGIWAKMNSLTDQAIIDKLYEASAAGVRAELVIRGICCLRAGVEGLSENIEVRSIIGRFLEHSRIYVFANGATLPSAKARVYISSADLMGRNLDRRVEVLVPLRNRTIHDQVLEQVMQANLLDTARSWRAQPDGSYGRVESGEKLFDVHRYFMTNPSLSGRGSALVSGEDVPRLSLSQGS
ncbi:Polyphosphate kinase [Alteripontixanthobacter maritimus]|uniref:Polyphosphate kinase n=1 Tax=Alteripontixanthobacter maritimus TaxID=2161824 RepID=A0A369QB93_9SPHN|nr:RNA degradosome polyphosphate kinase [Alteripontixanthobacter maritimus]RDC60496.1 Polyphosphate kinase [Alteripontixanthobacter maritimus]